ncbi:hypothetical protein [Streptomyces sp. NPDC002889]|uniref:hypothetical protein n=1 Tax=Streptomyces sp. NPDC002889 TaxID=3364669 RepID=UPI00368D0E92
MSKPRRPFFLFVVDVSGDAAEYEQRLRSVLLPAVRLGAPRIVVLSSSPPADGQPKRTSASWSQPRATQQPHWTLPQTGLELYANAG